MLIIFHCPGLLGLQIVWAMSQCLKTKSNFAYMRPTNVTILWRPVGPKELELIEQSGWKEFPPRLPEQPIFYPVMNEEYAIQISRDWNVRASGSGYVTRFSVRKDFLAKYEIKVVGGSIHQEYWIPAEDLSAFNQNIVDKIEVIAEFN